MFWWIVGTVVVLVLAYLAWTYNRLSASTSEPTVPGATSTSSSSGVGTWFRLSSRRSRVMRDHESTTLESVVRSRSQATQAGSLTERGESERGLSTAVGRLFALAEAYPELKASQNFQELQKSLVEIENNVQYARRYYNAVIRDLNTLVREFSVKPGRVGDGFRRADLLPAR